MINTNSGLMSFGFIAGTRRRNNNPSVISEECTGVYYDSLGKDKRFKNAQSRLSDPYTMSVLFSHTKKSQ